MNARFARSYNKASRQAIGMVTKKNAPAAFTTGASVSVVAGTRNHLKLLFEAAA
jgi:hypothetical protein